MRNDKKPFSRKCASCGLKREKASLIRIVRDKEGHVLYDRTGHAEGRGAYLCIAPDCIEKAEKKGSLERSFRSKIDPFDKEKLFEEIKKFAEG